MVCHVQSTSTLIFEFNAKLSVKLKLSIPSGYLIFPTYCRILSWNTRKELGICFFKRLFFQVLARNFNFKCQILSSS